MKRRILTSLLVALALLGLTLEAQPSIAVQGASLTHGGELAEAAKETELSANGVLPLAWSAYTAMPDLGQTTMYVPAVMKRWVVPMSTHLFIQNLTGATMQITVDFYGETTTLVHKEQRNVPGFSPWHLELESIDDADIPYAFAGFAVVSAPGAIAVVVDDASVHSEMTYDGLMAGAAVLYAPSLYKDDDGWTSMVAVRNVDSSAYDDVHVDYSSGAHNQAYSVGPHGAAWFIQGLEWHYGVAHFTGIVTATEPLLAGSATLVNEDPRAQTRYELQANGSYLIDVPFTAKGYDGWTSTVRVQNTGTTPTIVNVTYEGHEGHVYGVSVAAGDAQTLDTANESFLPNGYHGTLYLQSTSEPIVAHARLDRADTCYDSAADYVPPASSWWSAYIFYPFAPKSAHGWDATLVVENASLSPGDVYVYFYDQDGLLYSPGSLGGGLTNPFLLDGLASQVIPLAAVSELPDGFYAAVVETNQVLTGVAIVRAQRPLVYLPLVVSSAPQSALWGRNRTWLGAASSGALR